MLEEFRSSLQTVAGAQQLGEALNYLPEPAHELDVRLLRDAGLTIPTEDWPNAHLNRALELYRTGDTYRGLTRIAPDILVRTLADLVGRDRLEFGGGIEAEFVEGLRDDPDRAAPWHAFAEQVWVYDGRIPLNMHLIDDTVVLWLGRVDGDRWEGRGLLESENPTVVAWAEALYRDYRDAAEPLDPARLPDP